MQKQQQHENVTDINNLIIKKTKDLEMLHPMSGHWPVAHKELDELIKYRDRLLGNIRQREANAKRQNNR